MIIVNVQINPEIKGKITLPTKPQFKKWVSLALRNRRINAEVTLRLTDATEVQRLNQQFRDKNKPTNVLSFTHEPFEHEAESDYLGDIVLCAPVIEQEATLQKKDSLAHWAHLTIHGVLHLLGYDHEIEADAAIMEQIEIDLLMELKYDNPYDI